MVQKFIESQTVSKLSPEVKPFSREALFAEFRSKLRYGFLEGICLFSQVYESQLKRATGEADPEEDPRPRLDFVNRLNKLIIVHLGLI